MAVAIEVGDGTNTLFWCDRWIMGQRIQDLAPLIFSMVSRRITTRRLVSEALSDMTWTRDINGIATVEVIAELVKISDVIAEIALHQDTPDVHIWRLSKSGQYSAESAYKALFQVSMQFRPVERIWKSWAPKQMPVFHVASSAQLLLNSRPIGEA